MVLLGLQLLLYLYLALFSDTGIAAFVIVSCVLISLYGGGFAIMATYVRDVFEALARSIIQDRLLTAWAAAGVVGPFIFTALLDTKGAPGTVTAEAYQAPLLVMVGVVGLRFVANCLVNPVPEPALRGPRRSSRSRVVEGVGSDMAFPTRVRLAWPVIIVALAYGLVEALMILPSLFA